jgi:hypothetical protein
LAELAGGADPLYEIGVEVAAARQVLGENLMRLHAPRLGAIEAMAAPAG